MKCRLLIFYALGIIPFICGCNPPKADRPDILVVTIEPQRYFLETIAGDRYDIECIVPSGANPESADFTPSQMMYLNKGIAYFKVGYLGIETMLIDKVAQSNPDLKIINTSDGIKLIGEEHIHSDDDHHPEEGQTHGHIGGDPHTWSSVRSAKIMAYNMYQALLEIDSVNEAEYTANYNKLLLEFNRTDSIIKSYLEKVPSKAFIIYHPALSYFADEYGLTQYPIEYEGKNPSPSQLKELIDKANSEGVKVVFIQREFDTKNAETIADAVGGKTVPVNLLSYYWSQEMIKIAKALALENI